MQEKQDNKKLICQSKLNSLEDTRALAKKLVDLIANKKFIGLYGELGSGKTTLISMLVSELGIATPVSSPTYTIEHEYKSDNLLVKHLDLYRLTSAPLDFFEKQSKPVLYLIEWPDKVAEVENMLELEIHFTLTHHGDDEVIREVRVFER